MNANRYVSIDIDFWVKDTKALTRSLMTLMDNKGDIPYEPGDPSEIASESLVPPGLENAHTFMCHIPG